MADNQTTALYVLNSICHPSKAAGHYVKPSDKTLEHHGGKKLASGQGRDFWAFMDGSNLTVGDTWADVG